MRRPGWTALVAVLLFVLGIACCFGQQTTTSTGIGTRVSTVPINAPANGIHHALRPRCDMAGAPLRLPPLPSLPQQQLLPELPQAPTPETPRSRMRLLATTPADAIHLTAPRNLVGPSKADPRVDARLVSLPPQAQAPQNEIPADMDKPATWWQNAMAQPLRPNTAFRNVSLEALICDALLHSPRVNAISEQALISQTAVVEADAAFDVTSFVEAKYASTNDPVGNLLTTGPGGSSRLIEGNTFFSGGMRKKNLLGGQFEVSQQLGHQTSNSQFFDPPNQGNARLSLSYTQPLLNGSGSAYNRSLTVLAHLDTSISWDTMSRDLQIHLLQITEAYWELFAERASLLQKQRSLRRGEVILRFLEERQQIDALRNQILQARAAVAMRRTGVIRAHTVVRNVESRLRSLVNAPDMLSDRDLELIPTDVPANFAVPVDLQHALIEALKNRPELDQAMQEIRAAGVRLEMSKNELMPALDLVVETYVAGLQGESAVATAFGNQFTEGAPGYSAGLVFEVPLHQRAAKARYQRRMLETRKLTSDFRNTVASISAEVEVAVREVTTAFREVQARRQSVLAAAAKTDFMLERWKLLAGDDRSSSFVLEDLLTTQDRLVGEEYGYVASQAGYAASITRLKQRTGTLLQQERVSVAQSCSDCGIPQVHFHKQRGQGVEQILPAPAPTPVSPAEEAPVQSTRLPRNNGLPIWQAR